MLIIVHNHDNVQSTPLPVHHGVGRGHGLYHESGREVGHEGQHDYNGSTQRPAESERTVTQKEPSSSVHEHSPGVVESCWQGQGTSADDQVEDIDESREGGVLSLTGEAAAVHGEQGRAN